VTNEVSFNHHHPLASTQPVTALDIDFGRDNVVVVEEAPDTPDTNGTYVNGAGYVYVCAVDCLFSYPFR
jgi:hypothetical protein